MMPKNALISTVVSAIMSIRQTITTPKVAEFETLAPILAEIVDLLSSVDLGRLTKVPNKSLEDIAKWANQANSCIGGYIIPSYPPEQSIDRGTVRPQGLMRNESTLNFWRAQLESIHSELYPLVNAVVAQQQRRVAEIRAAVPTQVNVERSTSLRGGEQRVWRYMPLRNLLRMEEESAIWLSSLQRLRGWSEAHMADIREGDIPPIVQQLREDYERSMTEATIDNFRERHSLSHEDFEKLSRNLNFTSELENAYVSSWSRKRNESSTMWSAYGDGGRGVAIQSEVSRLITGPWRIPFQLSGMSGPSRVKGVIVREVRYLNFDHSDQVPPVDDLHLPLMKRSEFEDEREIRLIAFITRPLVSEGLALHCNLLDVITGIVVGPQADFDATVAEINTRAPDFRNNISIVRSSLARS